MHEYSIVQALIARVEREAAAHSATAVHRLRVQIGEMSGVEVSLLETAFELFRERTICEGAVLTVVPVAATWQCPKCATDLAPGVPLRCQACSTPARLVAGDEIVLERIEMEVADAAPEHPAEAG